MILEENTKLQMRERQHIDGGHLKPEQRIPLCCAYISHPQKLWHDNRMLLQAATFWGN
jgi:hypothetical protein